MPFKTRRQKQAAEKRRFSFSLEETVGYQNGRSWKEKGAVAQIEARDHGGERHLQESYDPLIGDLIKIGLVALAIIGCQLVIRLFIK